MKSSAVKSAKKASGPLGPAGSSNSAATSSVPPLAASSAGSKIKINESSEKLELQEVHNFYFL
jgi:hypothetical protein